MHKKMAETVGINVQLVAQYDKYFKNLTTQQELTNRITEVQKSVTGDHVGTLRDSLGAYDKLVNNIGDQEQQFDNIVKVIEESNKSLETVSTLFPRSDGPQDESSTYSVSHTAIAPPPNLVDLLDVTFEKNAEVAVAMKEDQDYALNEMSTIEEADTFTGLYADMPEEVQTTQARKLAERYLHVKDFLLKNRKRKSDVPLAYPKHPKLIRTLLESKLPFSDLKKLDELMDTDVELAPPTPQKLKEILDMFKSGNFDNVSISKLREFRNSLQQQNKVEEQKIQELKQSLQKLNDIRADEKIQEQKFQLQLKKDSQEATIAENKRLVGNMLTKSNDTNIYVAATTPGILQVKSNVNSKFNMSKDFNESAITATFKNRLDKEIADLQEKIKDLTNKTSLTPQSKRGKFL